MAELLPPTAPSNNNLTEKIRRKLRKVLTLSCASQDRYFKKFLKRLEKEYCHRRRSNNVTIWNPCDWLSSCAGGGRRRGSSGSTCSSDTESSALSDSGSSPFQYLFFPVRKFSIGILLVVVSLRSNTEFVKIRQWF